MAEHCPSCRKALKPAARFCGRCGEPVLRERPIPPVPLFPKTNSPAQLPSPTTCRTRRRATGKFLVGMMAVFAGVIVLRITRSAYDRTPSHRLTHDLNLHTTEHHHGQSRQDSSPFYTVTSSGEVAAVLESPPPRIINRILELGENQSQRLYALLKDRDISVEVGMRKGGLSASGTPQEISVLESIVQIAQRGSRDWKGGGDDRSHGPFVEITYELKSKRAKEFAHAFSLADRTVNVVRRGSRVTVTASKDDQRVISRFVRILGGKEKTE